MNRTLISAITLAALAAGTALAAPCGSAILLEKSTPAAVQSFTLDANAVARMWSAGAASQHYNNTACATGCEAATTCTTAPCVAITGLNWLNATCGSAGTTPSRTVFVLERPTTSSGGRWAAVSLDKNSADANTDIDAKAASFCSGCSSVASAYLGGGGVPVPTSSVASGGDLTIALTWTAPDAAAQALNNSGTSLVTSYAIYYRRGTSAPANDGVKSGWTRVSDTDANKTTNGFSTDAAATVVIPLGGSSDDVYLAIGVSFDGTGDPVADADTIESSHVSAWAGPLSASGGL